MIVDYKIKNNILYLYIDADNEFAKYNSTDEQNIQEVVHDFICKNKIIFNGTIIALVVSGTIIGKLLINKPTTELKINDYAISSFIMPNQSNEREENIINDEPNSVEATRKISENTINNKENNKKSPINLQNENINEDSILKSDIENHEDIINDEVNLDKSVDDTKNEFIVTIYRTNGTIISLELDEYLTGVVATEMPALFQDEALKCQAIIARTYTLKAIKNNRKLTDDESTQSYKSIDELKIMWGNKFDTYYRKIKYAVESTKDICLTYNGDYIEAVYHSTSNGYTEDAENVWGNSFPYLVSVPSSFDYLNPSFEMTTKINYEQLTYKIGQEVNSNSVIEILSRNQSNRVEFVKIDELIFTGVKFRNMLGLRSTDFEIEMLEDGIIFNTKGYGHGVGLSQYGASGMAKDGYSYEQILLHYYPGTTLAHL